MKRTYTHGGLRDKHGCKMVLLSCPNCCTERLVRFYRSQPESTYCQKCATRKYHKEHPYKDEHAKILALGAILVWVDKSHPYYAMANKCSRILEHRLVMAEHLGRCLTEDEVVHHLNEKRDDNQLENLMLMSLGMHTQLHYMAGAKLGRPRTKRIYTKRSKYWG